MIHTLRQHWPEYLMEAAELGLFMVSAGVFGVILEHSDSPIRQALPDAFLRRVIMGMAMGLTAIAIIYSPLGKQSGGHFNPAVTLTFLRLKKIAPWDATYYVVAQFLGGLVGMLLITLALRKFLADPAVNFVATLPGKMIGVAFFAELLISGFLMLVVLTVSNKMNWARFTGIFAGILVATYIAFEAPLSGMSMNPARSFASAVPAHLWTAFWIYLTAPPLGMLLAAEIYLKLKKTKQVICAKLHHHNDKRCIFLKCGYMK